MPVFLQSASQIRFFLPPSGFLPHACPLPFSPSCPLYVPESCYKLTSTLSTGPPGTRPRGWDQSAPGLTLAWGHREDIRMKRRAVAYPCPLYPLAMRWMSRPSQSFCLSRLSALREDQSLVQARTNISIRWGAIHSRLLNFRACQGWLNTKSFIVGVKACHLNHDNVPNMAELRVVTEMRSVTLQPYAFEVVLKWGISTLDKCSNDVYVFF